MKIEMSFWERLALLTAFAVLSGFASACHTSNPTDTMNAVCQAVKEKNVSEYKKFISKRKLMQYEELARRNNTSLDDLLKQYLDNIKCPSSAQLGGASIHGDAATLEAKETPTSSPDRYNFVREDGAWKLD